MRFRVQEIVRFRVLRCSRLGGLLTLSAQGTGLEKLLPVDDTQLLPGIGMRLMTDHTPSGASCSELQERQKKRP